MQNYTEITQGIEVSVKPKYIDKHSEKNIKIYIWSYNIEITNKSDKKYQLINRYWKIIDEEGKIQEVNGLGVVGEQPIIAPNKNYSYISNIHLDCPSGVMSGYYQMRDDEGQIINVNVPAFSLETPYIKPEIIH